MSHVACVSIEVKDLDALGEAAKRLGLELVRGQKEYRWYGQSVGDFPIPEGFTAEDLGKCENAIRIQGTKGGPSDPAGTDPYEIGIVKRRDGKPGWSLIWDFFAGGYGLLSKVGKDCVNLKREYAAVVAAKQARLNRFQVHESRQADGRIVLTLNK